MADDDRKWLERQTKLYMSYAAFEQLRRVSTETAVNMSAIVDRLIIDRCTVKEVMARKDAPLPPRGASGKTTPPPPVVTWQRTRRTFG